MKQNKQASKMVNSLRLKNVRLLNKVGYHLLSIGRKREDRREKRHQKKEEKGKKEKKGEKKKRDAEKKKIFCVSSGGGVEKREIIKKR